MSDTSDNPSIIFETKGNTKLFDKALALVLGVGVLPLALLLPGLFGAVLSGVGCPLWLSVTLGLAFMYYLLWLAWQMVAERLRFCLVFHSSYLQVGRGLVRHDLPYDDVEEVVLPGPLDEVYGIAVRSGKWTASVYLKPEDMVCCFELLGRVCPYAILDDGHGKERLPIGAGRPQRALLNIERYHRRAWIGAILALPGFLINNFCTVVFTLAWCRGEIVMRNSEVVRQFVVGALWLVGTLLCVGIAWVSFAKTRQARRERLAIATERGPAVWEDSKKDNGATPL